MSKRKAMADCKKHQPCANRNGRWWEERILLLQAAAELGIPLESVVRKRQRDIGTAIRLDQPKRCKFVRKTIDSD